MARINSARAVKNSWRFLGLVYLLMLTFFLALPIGRFLFPMEFSSAMLVATYMLLSLVTAFCFALAAVAWALCSFRERRRDNRRAELTVLLTAVVTTLGVGVYALVFTGVVRF
jgi:hypothetical protein